MQSIENTHRSQISGQGQPTNNIWRIPSICTVRFHCRSLDWPATLPAFSWCYQRLAKLLRANNASLMELIVYNLQGTFVVRKFPFSNAPKSHTYFYFGIMLPTVRISFYFENHIRIFNRAYQFKYSFYTMWLCVDIFTVINNHPFYKASSEACRKCRWNDKTECLYLSQ